MTQSVAVARCCHCCHLAEDLSESNTKTLHQLRSILGSKMEGSVIFATLCYNNLDDVLACVFVPRRGLAYWSSVCDCHCANTHLCVLAQVHMPERLFLSWSTSIPASLFVCWCIQLSARKKLTGMTFSSWHAF